MNSVPRRTSLGDKGDAVQAWQQFLLSRGYDIGKADGVHGPKTEAASKSYESKLAASQPASEIRYTPDQKRAIDSVLSIFETGALPSMASYSTCAILKDGAGISYGKHQCTDKSGSLDLVCKRYIELQGGRAAELSEFMPKLATSESSKLNPSGPHPEWLRRLMTLLRELGRDLVMQRAQDEVFDRVYFEPAKKYANDFGLTKALSLLVLYDTCIHSGPARVLSHCQAIAAQVPKEGGEESAWVRAYLTERRAWLSKSSNELVRKTVYRPEALSRIAASGNWDLVMPFICLRRTVV